MVHDRRGQIGFALKKVWRAALVIFVLRCLAAALIGTIPPVLLNSLSTAMEVLVFLFVAIFFHRLYLLGNEEYRYDKGIYIRFLTMLVILNFAFYALSIVQTSFAQSSGQIPGSIIFVGFVVLVITIVLWWRFLVIFPATAIGQKRSLGWAWALTKNYGWAIFGGWFLFFLLYLPFGLLATGGYFALDLPLQPALDLDWRLALILFYSAFLNVLMTGAAAVYASSVYRQLMIAKGHDIPAS